MEEYNKPRPKMSPKWAKIEKALFPQFGIHHFPGNVAAQAEILVNSAHIAALKTAVSTRQVIPGTDDYEAASKEKCLLEMRNKFLRSRSGAASTPGTASSSRTTSSGRTASSGGGASASDGASVTGHFAQKYSSSE